MVSRWFVAFIHALIVVPCGLVIFDECAALWHPIRTRIQTHLSWLLRFGVAGIGASVLTAAAAILQGIEQWNWAIGLIGMAAIWISWAWWKCDEVLIDLTNGDRRPSRPRQVGFVGFISLLAIICICYLYSKKLEAANKEIEVARTSTDGWLIPGSASNPPMTCGIRYDAIKHMLIPEKNALQIKDNETALLLGRNVFIETTFPRTVIQISDIPRLILDKGPHGEIAVTIDIFDSANKLIAKIERNHFKINAHNYFDSELSHDKSELRVSDDSGEEVLKIAYLNKRVVRINARLHFPELSDLLIINDKEMILGGSSRHDDCFRETGPGLPEINIYPEHSPISGPMTILRPKQPW